MPTAPEIIADSRDKMQKAIEHLKSEFSSVRTGRATPALVEKFRVDYYGSEVPLQQLAGFSVPEARVLVVSRSRRRFSRVISVSIRATTAK